MRTCARCGLAEGFPGSGLSASELCALCRAGPPAAEARAGRERLERSFAELADRVRPRGGVHCLVAFSGGKDSTYTLMLLRRRYRLRTLAVTFDNGFLSAAALENARRIVETLDSDHLVVKPRFELLRRIFAAVATRNPFPAKAVERASPVCNACMGLAKGLFLRLALERRIPILAWGWSPGQAPARAALFRLNAAMVAEMQRSRLAPLAALAGDGDEADTLEEFSPGGPADPGGEGLPYSANPLSFVDYDERAIVAEIERLGWRPPRDTDGNSTNCLLNLLANRLHLAQFGFHPYAFEIAGLVRGGFMTLAEGRAKLEDLGDPARAAEVARRLGLEFHLEPGPEAFADGTRR